MILYHGSYTKIEKPDLQHSRENIDFGMGFYLSSDVEMAKKWACAKKNSVVSVYEVDLKRISTHQFGLDYEWLDYVKANRRDSGDSFYDKFDMLIGPTADDKLFNTLQEYLDGTITSEQAIEYLNIAGFSNQYVFKNEKAIRLSCKYLDSIEIIGEEKWRIRQSASLERADALKKLKEAKRYYVQIKEAEIRGKEISMGQEEARKKFKSTYEQRGVMISFAHTLEAAVERDQYNLKDFIMQCIRTDIFHDFLEDFTMYIQEGTYIAARISKELEAKGIHILPATDFEREAMLAIKEAAYWVGYLMTYWRYMESIPPEEFLKYDFDEIIWSYEVLHTQEIEYAVDFIKREYYVG